ncbi:ABC transporter permease [Streptosporangiaceae bacterium NEAU-GS5]|nr:ABC transporter permease [Streptosporangiaceae bacterium NEAU-GS5]
MKKLALIETKLFLREPIAIFFAVALPVVLLLALGMSIPGFRDPDPTRGGERFVDAAFPSVIVLLSVATLAFSVLPTTLVIYRERGVLRRMATTPVRPTALLTVQLAINAATATLATVLALGVGHVLLDVPVPRMFAAFLGMFVLGGAALFAIGLFLTAVVPTARAMQAIGSAVFFPMMFLAGLWLPRDLMPEVLRRVSDITPTGAYGAALRDTMAGHAPSLLHVGVLVAWAALAGGAAVRLFRWQ